MASYPTAVKVFTTKNAGDTIQAADVDDLQDEVNAIEAGILNGTAPLNVSNSTLANLSVPGGSSLTTLQVTGASSFAGAVTFNAAATFAAGVTTSNVTIGGQLRLGVTSTTLSGGSTRFDNVVIGATTTVILVNTNSTLALITGLSGGAQGRALYFTNVNAATQMTLGNNNVNSSADCRMTFPGGADKTLGGLGGTWLVYDANASLWRGM